jgi:hypothetical protein
METAVFFGLNSGDRANKNFSTARRYLDDGTDDYNYTVDFGSERYVEFRVCVKAGSRRAAINKAKELLKTDYSPLHLVDHDLIKAKRIATTVRTWWEDEIDNSFFFDRGVARRQEASLNRVIEEMRDNQDCKWSVQFVN